MLFVHATQKLCAPKIQANQVQLSPWASTHKKFEDLYNYRNSLCNVIALDFTAKISGPENEGFSIHNFYKIIYMAPIFFSVTWHSTLPFDGIGEIKFLSMQNISMIQASSESLCTKLCY